MDVTLIEICHLMPQMDRVASRLPGVNGRDRKPQNHSSVVMLISVEAIKDRRSRVGRERGKTGAGSPDYLLLDYLFGSFQARAMEQHPVVRRIQFPHTWKHSADPKAVEL